MSLDRIKKLLNEFKIVDPDIIQKVKNENYGQELILDIHNVPKGMIHKKHIRKFAEKLADEIGMKRGPIYLWGEEKELGTHPDNPKIDGISCVQFVYTSSITIHAIDELDKVFVNIFSCKEFDAEKAKQFVLENFKGEVVEEHNIVRK